MKRILISVLLAIGASGAHAAAPLAQIQTMLAKPPMMCGHFAQSKVLSGVKRPLASEGRFCVASGKGILWRTLKPFPNTLRLTRDEIVHFQGERVAMRLEAKQEPVVRMINSVLFSLLAGDLRQLETMFEIDGSADKDSWKVALKARDPALAKAIGAISLEGGAYVKKIQIAEASGDRTEIGFVDIKAGDKVMTPEEAALL